MNNCRYVPHVNNDGDSFRVKCSDEEFHLRLYFVDAPEANLTYAERSREQSEYFGASIDETLKAGARARDYVKDALRGPFVVITRKATAPGRSTGVRYYGLVRVDSGALEELLIAQGLARIKGTAVNLPDGTKSRAHVEVLRKLEEQARRQGKGLWAKSRPLT